MSTYSGQNASVKIGSHLITEISSWSLDIAGNEIPVNVFGNRWARNTAGLKNWECTITGFYDPSDSSGQGALISNFISGELVSEIRLYVDDTYYFSPDTPNDAGAGGRIVSFSPSQSSDGVSQINISLAGCGAIELFPPLGFFFSLVENSQYIPILF